MRAAVGLANADAFAREHAIAETLQRSLLPDALPQIPALDLAVRYLPATDGADVGGDWYDAFPYRMAGSAWSPVMWPGARLLLYADGLIEDRYRDISDGLAILAETLRHSWVPRGATRT